MEFVNACFRKVGVMLKNGRNSELPLALYAIFIKGGFIMSALTDKEGNGK